MSYQPIEKPIPKYHNGEKVWGKRDCEDFKPYFFNKRYCKLGEKCKGCGYHHILYQTMCIGINEDKWQKIIS